LHMGGRDKGGEIYTSFLATQVLFAHLLCSQGDKFCYNNKQQTDKL
jgi:hypothetical protein